MKLQASRDWLPTITGQIQTPMALANVEFVDPKDPVMNGVFMLPGCRDPFNEKALRASRGTPFQLLIVSGNWEHLEAFKNEFQAKVLAGHPDSSDDLKPVHKLSQRLASSVVDVPLCLVLGSEGSGLSEKAMQFSELVSIPMANNFESFNVAVAGRIFLFMLQNKSTSNSFDLERKPATG